MQGRRILIVEDEAVIAMDMAQHLRDFGYEVIGTAADGEGALALAGEGRPDLVMMDIFLKGELDGIETARRLREILDVPVVFLTAYGDEATLARAMQASPYGYLLKPYRPGELRATIDVVLHKHELERRLRIGERWLACTLQCIGDGILATDPAGQVRFLNPMAEAMLGVAGEAARNGHVREVLAPFRLLCGRSLAEPVVAALAGEGEATLVGVTDRGRAPELHFEAEATPIRDESDRLLGAVLVVRDVTSARLANAELRHYQDRLERLVEERTADLSAALHEMETFTYAIAHDLRAPARAMSGYARMTLEDYRDALLPDVRERLERIADSGEAMGAMVDGLLDLARIGRREPQRREVDLAALARAVWNEVTAREPSRKASFEAPESAVALADPVLMRIVFANLLGNAFKFTRPAATARVSFGSVSGDDGTTWFVRDNGIGIDMAYAGKLFGAFQRLHVSEEFEGTGIGLATVQRILQQHGGRIWVESAPGAGATFHFTLG